MLPPRTWWQWFTGQPTVPYECLVGLWLNRMEILWQRVYTQYVGAQYAASLGDLPPELWLAVCDDEATAFECWSTTNNNRNRAMLERQLQAGQRVDRVM